MLAPKVASSIAAALPIPCELPHTMAVLPERFRSIINDIISLQNYVLRVTIALLMIVNCSLLFPVPFHPPPENIKIQSQPSCYGKRNTCGVLNHRNGYHFQTDTIQAIGNK